ncbi:MAG: class I SAM-dependent methyltransferase [Planctomyces sp.]|nr:class I SAM-dependent methyltransferase [Planctomyces sp.]
MPTVLETQQHFDKSAAVGVDSSVDKWPAIAPHFEAIPRGARIIECGAGTGLYTLPLLKAGYRVVANDISLLALKRLKVTMEAAGLADGLSLAPGDYVSALADVADPIQAATFIKVLHHFPDRDHIRAALHATLDRLPAGGRIVMFEPNGLAPHWFVRYRLLDTREKWLNERNIRLIRQSLFEDLCDSRNDCRLSLQYRFLIPGTFVSRIPGLSAADRLLTSLPGLRRFSANLICIIDKASA